MGFLKRSCVVWWADYSAAAGPILPDISGFISNCLGLLGNANWVVDAWIMPLNSHIALKNIPAGQARCSCLFAGCGQRYKPAK